MANQVPVVIEHHASGHSGPGYYLWEYEYPEEGTIFLGEDEPTDEAIKKLSPDYVVIEREDHR